MSHDEDTHIISSDILCRGLSRLRDPDFSISVLFPAPLSHRMSTRARPSMMMISIFRYSPQRHRRHTLVSLYQYRLTFPSKHSLVLYPLHHSSTSDQQCRYPLATQSTPPRSKDWSLPQAPRTYMIGTAMFPTLALV
jgi:hypothetical protein